MAKPAPLSPLAPKSFPDLPGVDGVRFAAGEAGIRYRNRTDAMLAIMDAGTQAAGVFTRSKCPSAPVDWCRARLKGGKARALVVNSGNANAFTGKVGAAAVKRTAEIAAAATGAKPAEIFLASTGVIGEPLDFSRYYGRVDDPRTLRWVTDQVMAAIHELSGQTYVEAYGTSVKSGSLTAAEADARILERPGINTREPELPPA